MAVSRTLILAPNVVARYVVVDIETGDGDGMCVATFQPANSITH